MSPGAKKKASAGGRGTRSKTRNGEKSPTSSPRRPRKRRGLLGPIIFGGCIGLAVAFGPRVYRGVNELWQKQQDAHETNRQNQDTPKVIRETYRVRRPKGGEDSGSKDGARDTAEGLGKISTAPEAPDVAAPSKAYQRSFNAAKDQLNAAQFAAAAGLFTKASKEEAPAATIAQVEQMAAACQVFDGIMTGVEPHVTTRAVDLYWIKLKGRPGKFISKVTHQTPTAVGFKKPNGISGEFKRSDIESMVPITQAQRDEQMRDELVAEKVKLGTDESLCLYLLAIKALTLNFKEESAGFLKKAWAIDQDLENTVREHWARKLFKTGAYYYSVGMSRAGEKKFDKLFEVYPDTKAAKLARDVLAEAARERMLAEVARKREEERKQREAEDRRRHEAEAKDAKRRKRSRKRVVVEEDEEVQVRRSGGPSGRDSENISKGNEAHERGLKLVNEGRSTASANKSTRLYKEAVKEFDKALSYYDKALKEDPGNQGLKDRMQETNMQRYWSRKLQRL